VKPVAEPLDSPENTDRLALNTFPPAAMGPFRKRFLLAPCLFVSMALGLGFPSLVRPALAGSDNSPGGKGAQVYCFMRNNGNNHQVSWEAAYGVVRGQSSGLFKTSRERAAVMITEAVVQNPATYPDCGRFLGDLFAKPAPSETNVPSGSTTQSRNATLAP
jgi:hypothetical protein